MHYTNFCEPTTEQAAEKQHTEAKSIVGFCKLFPTAVFGEKLPADGMYRGSMKPDSIPCANNPEFKTASTLHEEQVERQRLAQLERTREEVQQRQTKVLLMKRAEAEFKALGLHKDQTYAAVRALLTSQGFSLSCTGAQGEGLDRGLWLVGCDGARGKNRINVTFLMYRLATDPNDMTPYKVRVDRLVKGWYVSDPSSGDEALTFQFMNVDEILGRK